MATAAAFGFKSRRPARRLGSAHARRQGKGDGPRASRRRYARRGADPSSASPASAPRRQGSARAQTIGPRGLDRGRGAHHDIPGLRRRISPRAWADVWKSDKHRKQWATSLELAGESFGKIDVRSIDVAMIVKLLEPVWATTPETGSRLRGRIERVLDWATARGYRQGENPARWSGHLEHLLRAKPKAEHHAAMPIDELPRVHGRSSRSLLDLGARARVHDPDRGEHGSEAIGAKWSEIDSRPACGPCRRSA